MRQRKILFLLGLFPQCEEPQRNADNIQYVLYIVARGAEGDEILYATVCDTVQVRDIVEDKVYPLVKV